MCMPFELYNALITFHRALDAILAKYKWRTFLVYNEDVVIFLKTIEEHIHRVDEVLNTLINAGFIFILDKSKFSPTLLPI